MRYDESEFTYPLAKTRLPAKGLWSGLFALGPGCVEILRPDSGSFLTFFRKGGTRGVSPGLHDLLV